MDRIAAAVSGAFARLSDDLEAVSAALRSQAATQAVIGEALRERFPPFVQVDEPWRLWRW